MTSVFEALQDLLFPPQCLGCGQRLDHSRPPLFCAACAAALSLIRSPLCACCGLPFVTGADHLCGDCLAGRHAFDLARSLLAYRSPAADLILSLKFNGHLTGIATFKALLARTQLLDTLVEPDIILPVPLHVDRLRERGFNQALVIAQGCLPQWQKKIAPDLLHRRRPTIAQSLLSGQERRRNLHHVFVLAEPDRVTGAKVLLVDDVYTTGTTVNECSKILRRAGAERIEVLTLARSVPR